MKKALLAALCFIFAGLMLVSGTFALPDLNTVFADLTTIFEDVIGKPTAGGAGTTVDVELISDDTTKPLIPGGSVSRATSVENKGTGSVYFRLVYAIQYDEESWKYLDIDFEEGEGFIEHDWKDISISGTPYKMKVFTYTEALAMDTISPEVSISIAMDTAVTSEQIANYRSDFLQIQALAIETEAFNNKGYGTAVSALDAALPLNTLNPF